MNPYLTLATPVDCGDTVTVETPYGQTFSGMIVGMDFMDGDILPDSLLIDDGYRILEICQGTVTTHN